VLECLDAALVDHGKPAGEDGADARDIPRQAKVVRRGRLLDTADRYMADNLPERAGNKRREALGRALVSLQARRLIYHADGWYWRSSSLSTPASHGVA
jgi:hypothetical protein